MGKINKVDSIETKSKTKNRTMILFMSRCKQAVRGRGTWNTKLYGRKRKRYYLKRFNNIKYICKFKEDEQNLFFWFYFLFFIFKIWVKKKYKLKLASWTQFAAELDCLEDLNLSVRKQWNTCLLLFIQPDESTDLGHTSVIELLHRLFNLVLVDLDIHNEHKCVVLYLHGWLSGQSYLDDGIVTKLVFPSSPEDIWGAFWVAVF